MKRILSFVLILVMALSLAACKKPQQQAEGPAAAPTDTPAPDETASPEPTPVDSTPVPMMPSVDPSGFPQVFMGDETSFIYDPDGALYGFGANAYGQIGNGGTEDRNVPVFVANGLKPVIVGETVFALSSDNILWGWGRNDSAQLGLGDTENRTAPVELLHFVKQVERLFSGYMALTEGGELYCWGMGCEGSGISDERKAELMTPQLIAENVRSCGVRFYVTNEDELYVNYGGGWQKFCDGIQNALMQYGMILGEGTDGVLYSLEGWGAGLVKLPITDSFKAYSVSENAVYVLDNDGRLWSYDLSEAYESGAAEDVGEPKLLIENVIKFESDYMVDEDWGYDYKFALRDNGELWSWGNWDSPVLGKPESDDAKWYEPACAAENVRDFTTNGASTFIIKNDGEVYAAGEGLRDWFMHCALGTGSADASSAFVKVDVGKAAAVYTHIYVKYTDYDDGTDGVELFTSNFAVGMDGSIYAWGWNGSGCLGAGSNEEDLLTPAQVHLTK